MVAAAVVFVTDTAAAICAAHFRLRLTQPLQTSLKMLQQTHRLIKGEERIISMQKGNLLERMHRQLCRVACCCYCCCCSRCCCCCCPSFCRYVCRTIPFEVDPAAPDVAEDDAADALSVPGGVGDQEHQEGEIAGEDAPAIDEETAEVVPPPSPQGAGSPLGLPHPLERRGQQDEDDDSDCEDEDDCANTERVQKPFRLNQEWIPREDSASQQIHTVSSNYVMTCHVRRRISQTFKYVCRYVCNECVSCTFCMRRKAIYYVMCALRKDNCLRFPLVVPLNEPFSMEYNGGSTPGEWRDVRTHQAITTWVSQKGNTLLCLFCERSSMRWLACKIIRCGASPLRIHVGRVMFAK